MVDLKNVLQSQLDPEVLKAHYNSYVAAGLINVYNPVSIMTALAQSEIGNFWVQTGFLVSFLNYCDKLRAAIGEFPLLRKKIPDDSSALETVQMLLSGEEIEMKLTDITFSSCAPLLP